jgi:putative ABC transport system permease protein
MKGIFFLAWHYVCFHKTKTLILIGCIFLTAILPIGIRVLLSTFEQSLVQRADATPAMIGAKGSSLDLVLHGLYFDRPPTQTLPFSEVKRIRETGLANSVPVYSAFQAASFPIVGTSLDYFQQRGLEIQAGQPLATLGECVLGSKVASTLDLKAGDSLLSDRENLLDIAGKYPLKMKVAGILQPTSTPDDKAVFVDLKTAWVMDGYGHGHQELQDETDEEKFISRDSEKLIASAAVLPYTEITETNIDSFHFHGSQDDFPVSAILAFTSSEKDNTILQGEYNTSDSIYQFARPSVVVGNLMSAVFKIKRFFDANAMLIGVSTLLLLILVMLLSAKLRTGEMETLFKIGCSRGTAIWMQVAELAFVIATAAILVAIAAWTIHFFADDLIRWWIV